MSGPQGSDPSGWQGPDQPATGSETPAAYTQPQQQYPAGQYPYPQTGQYPSYGQPVPGYPPAQGYGLPGGQPGAYGQPPQYGQYPQYGQPGQYPQPGQYGGYPQPGAPEAGKKSARPLGGLFGALGAVLLAAVLILGFWKPGFFVTTKLDVNKAQQGVQQILTDESGGYGAKNVKDVKCNNGANPTVKKGDTFTCEVSIDGTKRQVTVTFQDDKGTYEVGRPK